MAMIIHMIMRILNDSQRGITVGIIYLMFVVNTSFALDVDEGRLTALDTLFNMMSQSELTTKVEILSKSKDTEKRAVAAYLLGEYFEALGPKKRFIILKRLLKDSTSEIRACALMACENNMGLIIKRGGDEIPSIIDKLRNDPNPETRHWANRQGNVIKREQKKSQAEKIKMRDAPSASITPSTCIVFQS